MADVPNQVMLESGFFHSVSKVQTMDTQMPKESQFKSAHSHWSTAIYTDLLSYCADEATADAFVLANPTVLMKVTMLSLTEVIGSNGQSWYVDNIGAIRRPMINPVDAPDPATGLPSIGFLPKLYTQADAFIAPTTGAFWYDPYAGMVKFAVGFTPADMGWGIPKLTAYFYIGESLFDNLITAIPTSKTFLNITGNQAGGIVMNVTANGVTWIKSQDNGLLGSDAITFFGNHAIKVNRNGVEQIKSTEVVWDSTITFHFIEPLYTNEQVTIFS